MGHGYPHPLKTRRVRLPWVTRDTLQLGQEKGMRSKLHGKTLAFSLAVFSLAIFGLVFARPALDIQEARKLERKVQVFSETKHPTSPTGIRDACGALQFLELSSTRASICGLIIRGMPENIVSITVNQKTYCRSKGQSLDDISRDSCPSASGSLRVRIGKRD